MSTQDVHAPEDSRWNQIIQPIRSVIFGKQDERLEYIMDSYFKLSQEGRVGVLIGGVVLGFFALLAMVTIYVAAIRGLHTELENSFEALNKLNDAKISYNVTKNKFNELEAKLSSANSSFSLQGFLETKAKESGLTATGFPPQIPTTDLAASNPLKGRYQFAKVEFRLQNASLKKIIEYVMAVEASPHMLKATTLRIKSRYQDKLYFDATLEIEALLAKQ